MEKAVIFDIDETIADLSKFDSEVYDREKYPETMNKFFGFARPITEVIKFLKESSKKFKILFVTARPEEARQITLDWLAKNVGIPNFKLYMRSDGDTRSSEIIKNQIYRLSIEPNFDVQFAVDDNPDNRNMFKGNGIMTIDPKDLINFVS